MAQSADSSRVSHGSDQAALEGSQTPPAWRNLCSQASVLPDLQPCDTLRKVPPSPHSCLMIRYSSQEPGFCWDHPTPARSFPSSSSAQQLWPQSIHRAAPAPSPPCQASQGSLSSPSQTHPSFPCPSPCSSSNTFHGMLAISLLQPEQGCTTVWHRALISPGDSFSNPSLDHTLLFSGRVSSLSAFDPPVEPRLCAGHRTEHALLSLGATRCSLLPCAARDLRPAVC